MYSPMKRLVKYLTVRAGKQIAMLWKNETQHRCSETKFLRKWLPAIRDKLVLHAAGGKKKSRPKPTYLCNVASLK